METKGIHLKQSADTDYKRSVFDICTVTHRGRTGGARPCDAWQGHALRVDEDEWEQRLNAMLAAYAWSSRASSGVATRT